jgi:hypothetical protein
MRVIKLIVVMLLVVAPMGSIIQRRQPTFVTTVIYKCKMLTKLDDRNRMEKTKKTSNMVEENLFQDSGKKKRQPNPEQVIKFRLGPK